MEFIRNAWTLFTVNARTAIVFEAVYRLVFTTLFVPLCLGFVDLAMSASSLSYLCDANLAYFLSNPLTWLLTLIALIFLALCSLFEMSALIIVMQAGKERHRLRFFSLCRLAAIRSARIVRPVNWLLIPFVILLVPLTNFALTSSAIADLHLPEFIGDFILNNMVLTALLAVGLALLYVHAFRLSFGLHFFTLRDETWMQARKASFSLVKGNAWLLIRRVGGVLVAFFLVAAVLAYILDYGIAMLTARGAPLGESIALGLLFILLLVLYACASLPLSYAALSATFYECVETRGETLPPFEFERNGKTKRKRTSYLVTCGIVALSLCSLGAYVHAHGIFQDWPDAPASFQNTAHRGASKEAPENTLAAFQAAIDEGADWVELDVQQTSDGVLMVMHDSNLKRTTGLDKEFWQVTYDEIKGLDAGSWFSPEYAGEKIPTLEDALQLCKGKIRMNIEVKPDGHGKDLEQKTVELINKHNMKDDVAVASITYDALKRVKDADPSMATMYDMTIAYGYLPDIAYVDYFSVDDFFVTQEMVNDVRASGKTIFAWTVNDPSNMAQLLGFGIDGLVTDNVPTAQKIELSYTDPYISSEG